MLSDNGQDVWQLVVVLRSKSCSNNEIVREKYILGQRYSGCEVPIGKQTCANVISVEGPAVVEEVSEA